MNNESGCMPVLSPPPMILSTNRLHPVVADRLRTRFALTANDGVEPWPRADLLSRAADAAGIIAFMTDSVDDDFLAACPRLRIIAGALKGWDNFDVGACTRRGIWFTAVPDLLTEPTAELAVGLMIGLLRKLAPGERHVRSGSFRGWRPLFYGGSLQGARVGIVGMGAVGRAIARKLSGFDAILFYADREPLPAAGEGALNCRRLDFETLLATCDVIVLAAPLSPETRHMIDADRIARMRPGAHVVNIARGSLVCEAAVAAALRSGRLGGYAADVFEFEDWAQAGRPAGIGAELLALDDCTLFTPHIGSAVAAVRQRIELEAALNIMDWADGKPPRGAINQPEEA